MIPTQETDGSSPGTLDPGTLVEMTEVLVATDAAKIRAYHILGKKRPAGSVNGRDYFGVSIGEKACVLRRDGDILQVEFLGGNWSGRSGWVGIDAVRIPPSEAESSIDVTDGLDLLARRQIYAAAHAAGIAASAEAEARYPFDRMPTEARAIREYLKERDTVYETAKARGRVDLLARYGVDADQLDRIEAEGDRERWPSWDGLADEQGPIPTFGPARTDDRGRIVMGEPEKEARRAAAIRALGAVGRITDETDTDEVWRETSERFEGVR